MIPRTLQRSLLLVLALAVPAVAPPAFAASDASRGLITGTATYRERVALTPAAVFEATLEEVSRPDARAEVVARVRKRNPGQVPIAFEITYDPRRIETRKTYVVRASIYEDGRLRFTGKQPYPAQAHGHGRRVTILMRRVPAGHDTWEDGRGTAAGLENTRWRPVRIGDRHVVVSGREREPWIELERRSMRVTGSGGCNRITGSYEAGNGTLRFDRLISTMLACPSMDTETAFLRALQATRGYRIRGRILELKDDRGMFLVRLEERNPM